MKALTRCLSLSALLLVGATVAQAQAPKPAEAEMAVVRQVEVEVLVTTEGGTQLCEHTLAYAVVRRAAVYEVYTYNGLVTYERARVVSMHWHDGIGSDKEGAEGLKGFFERVLKAADEGEVQELVLRYGEPSFVEGLLRRGELDRYVDSLAAGLDAFIDSVKALQKADFTLKGAGSRAVYKASASWPQGLTIRRQHGRWRLPLKP